MANRDRLTALDAVFLHLERSGAHMHVAGVLVFEGEPPAYDELVEAHRGAPAPRAALPPEAGARAARPGAARVGRRPALQRALPRAPQRAARAGRPTSSCATSPGACSPCRWTAPSRCGRSSSSRGSSGDRFAIISKTHHALVDGVSGVDITSVLFDTSPDARARRRPGHASGCRVPSRPTPSCWPRRWSSARPCRPRAPAALRALTRAPRQVLGQAGEWLVGVGAMAWAGLSPAPPSPLQRADRPAPALHVGRRRRRALQGDQERPGRHAQRRRALGGRAGARALPAPPRRSTPTGSCSRRWSRCRCAPTTQRGALGNRVAAMWAPLPVGVTDPEAVLAEVAEAMRGLKESGQAVGAVALTSLADFAPPTIMSPGRAAAGAPALLQPRRHQRPGPADPALPARPPDDRASIRSCRSPTTRRWASRS